MLSNDIRITIVFSTTEAHVPGTVFNCARLTKHLKRYIKVGRKFKHVSLVWQPYWSFVLVLPLPTLPPVQQNISLLCDDELDTVNSLKQKSICSITYPTAITLSLRKKIKYAVYDLSKLCMCMTTTTAARESKYKTDRYSPRVTLEKNWRHFIRCTLQCYLYFYTMLCVFCLMLSLFCVCFAADVCVGLFLHV